MINLYHVWQAKCIFAKNSFSIEVLPGVVIAVAITKHYNIQLQYFNNFLTLVLTRFTYNIFYSVGIYGVPTKVVQ